MNSITFVSFPENLWDEPIPAKKVRKPRAKKAAAPAFSPVNQTTNRIAAELGINNFAMVEHPLTHQRMAFYAASNDLQKFYGWMPSRIQQWAKREKHQM
jgi:hypothetical protein